MNYLINYADLAFKNSQQKNSISGIQHGFDSVLQYSKKDIDKEFYIKNENILSKKRGAGYWLWKPYIIYKTLKDVRDGDIIFYSDSGSEFIKDVTPLVNLIKEQGIVAFKMSGHHKEREYTRRSVIKALDLPVDKTAITDQNMASFIGVVKAPSVLQMINIWLEHCQVPSLILDTERQGNEFPEFIDHRHDQSLWSLITKKFNIYCAPDPTQWGLTHNQTTEQDMFINHHRSKG